MEPLGRAVVVPLDGRGPMYPQIYRGMGGMILDGTFASGARLPATRALADDLGVSRNIVPHQVAARVPVAGGSW